ncbi:rab proteins geranylgeranyltransferase component A [Lentithecium fluviatile CBS 122367]|uniref:Rab proteins geranylgeranyltransferase n=1 Tax=Lentithecium fluviatile CBS 122367 TaxID=1168545 RepID=A0A6G1JG96_9PLEO|nr:rab proteins geranylgeranyltransferase component A [Lentithecium fluviatile CBS 122367]
MDTLDKTEWDVLIVGTGLQQSLLALALSRSGKRILHIDENHYYGGAEAAFSLQEAEAWVNKVNEGSSSAFSQASIFSKEHADTDPPAPTVSFSRAYSLALRPNITYTRSRLLEYLVSSKVFRQLEFVAVGSWWVYTPGSETSPGQSSEPGKLLKVPNGREDVFQDPALDFKAKRALMKFLRFIAEYEEQTDVWEQHRTQPFPAFLAEQFKIPATLQGPLLALTLSSATSNRTTTEFALPRIALHLRSIGVFGAGFGAVLPKWGGLSEITQVACRASAVGGAVYVLGKGLSDTGPSGPEENESTAGVRLHLKEGEVVTTKWIVDEATFSNTEDPFCKSVSIVSPPLTKLFPPVAEDAPAPASAVVVFPSGSLSLPAFSGEELPPVHIHVHSSDTGECPTGQNVLYASTSLNGDKGFQLLQQATNALLSSVDAMPLPNILWSLQYEQHTGPSSDILPSYAKDHALKFPPMPLDSASVDSVFDYVKEAWQMIMGDEAGEFLVFADREAYDDDE